MGHRPRKTISKMQDQWNSICLMFMGKSGFLIYSFSQPVGKRSQLRFLQALLKVLGPTEGNNMQKSGDDQGSL